MAGEMEQIGACRLYRGDALEVLPTLETVDICITDPPYGAGKAAWDKSFPLAWYPLVRERAACIVVITGSCGLQQSIPLVGADFVDVIAARNLNGMTRGPLGFGNWLAAVIAKGKPKNGMNAFDFSVIDTMPDHPTPKPLSYMLRLITRVSEHTHMILDPFMGSGTTGVACVKLGRSFIGIEIEDQYFQIACKRIEDAYKQLDLFIPISPPPRQGVLL